MHSLLDFLVRAGTWMLFIVYVLAGCILLFARNPWQHHVYLSSANAVTASVYEAVSNVTDYFNLKSVNEDLQHRNSDLELEVLSLRHQLRQYIEERPDSNGAGAFVPIRYGFIIAHVINNSISRPYNYITIEKGSLDGIEPEMGVVDVNGVVGIVNIVTEHTARIISVLNPNLRLSCKVLGSDNIGSLVWDGHDSRYAVLEELPKHAVYQIGDTIVTSGFSSAFPEGVAVGTVKEEMKYHDDNFHALRVELFTDFSTLGTVRVITDGLRDEIREVENEQMSVSKK